MSPRKHLNISRNVHVTSTLKQAQTVLYQAVRDQEAHDKIPKYEVGAYSNSNHPEPKIGSDGEI